MRELEFRAMRVDNREWVQGYDLLRRQDWVDDKRWVIRYFMQDGYSCNETPKTEDFIEVRPETVGQYTGKKDRDGVEIYGDDIARFNHHGKRLTGKVFQTVTGEWTISAGTVGESTDLYYGRDQKDIEVIGDIHTTPQLMEGK